jgi:hypothetical protein
MRRPLAHALVSGLVVLALSLSACGSDDGVSTSSCSSSAKTLPEAECKDAGDKAGCEVSRVAGKGCEFERCKSAPSCPIGQPTPTPTVDAGRDPKCDRAATNGLFSETPPCADFSTVTVNGNTQYACKCGACPCGYRCGSIALPQGGVLSSVCAP